MRLSHGMRCLNDTLESYIRWRMGDSDLSIRPELQLPVSFVTVRTRLDGCGCWWGQTINSGTPQIFGIRSVEEPFPSRFGTGKAVTFDSLQDCASCTRVDSSDVEPYLIIQIVDGRTARADLAILVDGREWHVLDEHLVRLMDH